MVSTYFIIRVDDYENILSEEENETLKYCKKNIYEGKITCPTCYGRDITNEKE